jgi:hypothetical protein
MIQGAPIASKYVKCEQFKLAKNHSMKKVTHKNEVAFFSIFFGIRKKDGTLKP